MAVIDLGIGDTLGIEWRLSWKNASFSYRKHFPSVEVAAMTFTLPSQH